MMSETHGHDAQHNHVVSLSLLVQVFVALLVLTVLTVAVTKVDMGGLNLAVALAIAVLKGALVVLFFMHLWWDSPFNSVIVVSALVFLAVFLGICILDASEYDFQVRSYEVDRPWWQDQLQQAP